MTYECECTVCGQLFDVTQGEYHYTWWRWVARRPTRPTSTKHRGA